MYPLTREVENWKSSEARAAADASCLSSVSAITRCRIVLSGAARKASAAVKARLAATRSIWCSAA